MSARIAIIGAGAIGARHLQGLARCERMIKVDVVDPSEPARARAANLLAETVGLKCGEVAYHADISTLIAPDIAIVATSSRDRAGAISDLIGKGVRQFVLEKVLFTKLSDYDLVDRLFAEHRVSAWVNCVRRAYPRASTIMQAINGRPFNYQVVGQGWGLGCNLIHHIDEIAMLSGQSDIELRSDGLAPGSISAKRDGYIEFIGTISGLLRDGSVMTATC